MITAGLPQVAALIAREYDHDSRAFALAGGSRSSPVLLAEDDDGPSASARVTSMTTIQTTPTRRP